MRIIPGKVMTGKVIVEGTSLAEGEDVDVLVDEGEDALRTKRHERAAHPAHSPGG